MRLIVGLGNPGKEYFGTRHNVGFHSIDYISQQWGIKVTKLKKRALVGEGKFQNEKVILAKPQTYMNASGEAVRELMGWYKLLPKDIIVIYDDISIEVGKLRIRPQGSAGGHNGMKSVIFEIGSDDFIRIKLGVGRPSHPRHELVDYVLGKLDLDEQKIIFEVLRDSCSAVEEIIKGGVEAAMNKYNGKIPEE